MNNEEPVANGEGSAADPAVTVDARLEDITSRLKKLEGEKKEVWPRFKALSPLISALLVAILGIWATHSVTGALEKERFELSYLEAMRGLMFDLGKPGVEAEQAKATGVLLGGFGARAVPALVHDLGLPGQVRLLAAREGLRAAAFNDPDKTVEILIRVMENRTGLFNWQTQKEVVVILGEVGSREALPVLAGMRDLLSTDEGASAYQTMVRPEPIPDEKNLSSLREAIIAAIDKLEKLPEGKKLLGR